MNADAFHTMSRYGPWAGGRLARVVRAARSGATDPHLLLTPEQFQSELAVLGLSGEKFGPEDYADALGQHLDLTIRVLVIQDASYPELSRRLALSGRLAELCLYEGTPEAVILVPGSLPPCVFALTVLHELGHLAAGDHLVGPARDLGARHDGPPSGTAPVESAGRRLARRPPFPDELLQEREADLRACYALLAGCLGPESPHAQKMYDVL